MKKTFFALVAMVIAVAFTACKKDDNLKQCFISVTNVTENSIVFRCEYAPSKGDLGYNLFLALTNEINDDMRNYILATYHEVGALNKSDIFTCSDLVSNQKYCILAVTYQNVDGEVTIHSIESLDQSTLAENSGNVVVSDATTTGANFTLVADPKGYDEENFRVYADEKNEGVYYAHIVLTPYESDDKLEENCFSNGYLKCSVNWGEINEGDPKTYTFYGAQPDSNLKYKAEITVNYMSDKSINRIVYK